MFAAVIPARRTPPRVAVFDYAVPPEYEDVLRPGQLVRIPFRGGDILGVIRNLSDQSTVPPEKLRPLKEIISPAPLLNKAQLKFLTAISNLTRTSLGWLLTFSLPSLRPRQLPLLKTLPPPLSPAAPRPVSEIIKLYRHNEERAALLTAALPPSPGQTLIIVPEITDADYLCRLLPASIKNLTLVYTGELTENERSAHWLAVYRGEKQIVIGTRAAFWLPFSQLTAIIIDDEGNPSHKNFDMAPRLHNRDAARLLARCQGSVLYLISPTPSLETYATLATEPAVPALPPLRLPTIIDLNEERRAGETSPLSSRVQDWLRRPLRGDIFLFLNRRGSTPFIICRDCQEVWRCSRCRQTFTYHEKNGRLICHRCNVSEPLPTACPRCQGINFAYYGTGTEKLEQIVRRLVGKEVPIIRLDRDTAFGRARARALMAASSPQSSRLIIGTERAWPFLNWENLAGMVVVDADAPQFIPEFRATEYWWQTLRDASYRLPKTAAFFLQTKLPESLIWRALAKPELFYQAESDSRARFGYPPYTFIVRLYAGFASEPDADQAAAALYRTLCQLTASETRIKIAEALPTVPPLCRTLHYRVIIIKLTPVHWEEQWRSILPAVPAEWKVDLNPNTLLSF